MLQGNSVGRKEDFETGTLTQVWANAKNLSSKIGGVTFDWDTVAPLGADLTMPDGSVVKAGTRLLRYGMFIAKVQQTEVQTVTITGAPTGGTFTLSVTRNGVTRTTAPIAYNANAAAIAAALNALDNVDGIVSVSGNNPGPFSVTFAVSENVAVMTKNNAGLTGGTSPNITIATTTEGDPERGMYGLYDSTATDGRQNRVRGEIFFVDKNYTYDERMSAHPSAFDGGTVFTARMAISDTAMPGYMTRAQVEAAFPTLRFVSTNN